MVKQTHPYWNYYYTVTSWYCYIGILLFLLLLLLYLPYPSNQDNINIRQLTSGLKKLIGETTPVFWVDLEYMLRSRKRVFSTERNCFHRRSGFPWGDWHLVLFILLYILHDCLAVGPDLTLGVGALVPGMYKTHLKYGQCLYRSISIT